MTTRPTARLSLEALDARDAPANIDVTLTGGVVTIEGTDYRDGVSVRTLADGSTRVTASERGFDGSLIESNTYTYAPGAVQKVVFRGGYGDDVFLQVRLWSRRAQELASESLYDDPAGPDSSAG